MERVLDVFPPFACSSHDTALKSTGDASFACPECEQTLLIHRKKRYVLAEGNTSASDRDEKVKFAYRLYSFVYPVVALFACWFIWRGSVRHQIRFYRQAIRDAGKKGGFFIDAGTGDGSLTRLALRGVESRPAVLAVDLSKDMLAKAAKKLKRYPHKLFYVADIGQASLKAGAFPAILSFGTVHVFSDPLGALRRMRELLSDTGTFSGSYLLAPGTPRRDRFVAWAKRHGLLATSFTEKEFDQLVEDAGFEYVTKEHNGKMLLFTVKPRAA